MGVLAAGLRTGKGTCLCQSVLGTFPLPTLIALYLHVMLWHLSRTDGLKVLFLEPACLMLQQNNLTYRDAERWQGLIWFPGCTPSRSEPPPEGAPWLPASPRELRASARLLGWGWLCRGLGMLRPDGARGARGDTAHGHHTTTEERLR